MERENYFGEDESEPRSKKSLTLVIYDISDNRHRAQMVKLLEGFGRRVQKSAFEAWLDYKTYSRLCDRIERFVRPGDHVKVYRLAGSGETKCWGHTPDFEPEDILII